MMKGGTLPRTPITLVSQQPFVVVVHPSVPAKTLKELIALAKAKPGTLNYASSGAGGIVHLGTELFKSMAGVDVVHIPYKGGNTSHNDLIAGFIHMYLGTVLSTLPGSDVLKSPATTTGPSKRAASFATASA